MNHHKHWSTVRFKQSTASQWERKKKKGKKYKCRNNRCVNATVRQIQSAPSLSASNTIFSIVWNHRFATGKASLPSSSSSSGYVEVVGNSGNKCSSQIEFALDGVVEKECAQCIRKASRSFPVKGKKKKKKREKGFQYSCFYYCQSSQPWKISGRSGTLGDVQSTKKSGHCPGELCGLLLYTDKNRYSWQATFCYLLISDKNIKHSQHRLPPSGKGKKMCTCTNVHWRSL